MAQWRFEEEKKRKKIQKFGAKERNLRTAQANRMQATYAQDLASKIWAPTLTKQSRGRRYMFFYNSISLSCWIWFLR